MCATEYIETHNTRLLEYVLCMWGKPCILSIERYGIFEILNIV